MEYQDSKINLVINKLTKEQYQKAIVSGLIDDTQLYLVSDDRGTVQGDSRYALINKTPVLSSITIDGTQLNALTCQAEDLAITTIQVSSNANPLVVYMPSQDTDGARDFCVRIECLSSAPTVAFLGSGTESCDFESTDDSWATLEIGANLFNFTETKRQV